MGNVEKCCPLSFMVINDMQKLIVTLTKINDPNQTYNLIFDLLPSFFLPKWIERFAESNRCGYDISEPWALYNINDIWTNQYTVNFINEHIDICNSISPDMFSQKISSVDDQDTLNYIHSVFELHHGKLDEWKNNPLFNGPHGNKLRNSLSHINQTVHRCEGTVEQNPKIRVVYFDLPKTEIFSKEDYKLFTNSVEFGGVYTCYADVGKNLEALAIDEDDHHHDFVPNTHYSVDFQIKFWDDTGIDKTRIYKNFYEDNINYFYSKGYKLNDYRLTTGAIKIAQLQYSNKASVLEEISHCNSIKSAVLA